MKKILIAVIGLFIAICVSGCVFTIKPDLDLDVDNQTLSFVDAKFYDFYDDKECVALLFDYTNDSGENKCPTDGFVMGARQNGKVIDALFVGTNKTIAGTITPGTSVPTGNTARVAWLFVLRDDSPLTVIVSDGQEFTIQYEQIGIIE